MGLDIDDSDDDAILAGVEIDSSVQAQINKFAQAGRAGGSKTGPSKARKGTGANVARYWDRVYAGEIKHPRFDPANPVRKKSRSKRYADGMKLSPEMAVEREAARKKARTDKPRQAGRPAPIESDPASDAEFDDLMSSMGLGF